MKEVQSDLLSEHSFGPGSQISSNCQISLNQTPLTAVNMTPDSPQEVRVPSINCPSYTQKDIENLFVKAKTQAQALKVSSRRLQDLEHLQAELDKEDRLTPANPTEEEIEQIKTPSPAKSEPNAVTPTNNGLVTNKLCGKHVKTSVSTHIASSLRKREHSEAIESSDEAKRSKLYKKVRFSDERDGPSKDKLELN